MSWEWKDLPKEVQEDIFQLEEDYSAHRGYAPPEAVEKFLHNTICLHQGGGCSCGETSSNRK